MHRLDGDMEKVTVDEFMALFDDGVHDAIRAACRRFEATEVVCFENPALDSSACGDRTALPVGGPDSTHTLETADNGWLNDLPSQRQYPKVYVDAAELLEGHEAPTNQEAPVA